MRARSIKNKPEINQRLTRNALLKDYVAEIDRLKSDLMAAREKNGIFMAQETLEEMRIEGEMRQTELDEAKKQVEIVGKRVAFGPRGVRTVHVTANEHGRGAESDQGNVGRT